MRKGFAFLPMLVIALIGLLAGSTALSALKEKPGSALYGVQRAAETAPTNLFNYFSSNYGAGLKEKRAAEVKDVLRSEGKDAALAFASREDMLDEKLRLDIAQYVPLIDGTKENLITVFRLTTPPEVSLGKGVPLVEGTQIRIRDTDLVLGLEAAYEPGPVKGYTLVWENSTARDNFTLLSGGEAPIGMLDGKLVTASGRCDRDLCASLDGPFLMTDYHWSFLKVSEPEQVPRIAVNLVKGREYLATEYAPVRGEVTIPFYGRYYVSYGKSNGAVTVKVTPSEEARFFMKVCTAADYAANGTSCGTGLKNVTLALMDDQQVPLFMYRIGIVRINGDGTREVVCAGEKCGTYGGLVAMFSEDGRLWDASGRYTENEMYFVDNDKPSAMWFDLFFGKPVRYLEARLPEGQYFMERHGILFSTDNASVPLEYGLLSREYIEGINVYVDVYGIGGSVDRDLAKKETELKRVKNDTRSVFTDFYKLTGRIPKTQRARISASVNPFAPQEFPTHYAGVSGTVYGGWASRGVICHEFAHGLQIETGKADIGAEYHEGYAEMFCVYAGYRTQRQEYPRTFGECIERYSEVHDLGECLFNNTLEQVGDKAGFFRRLLDFPCEIKVFADPKTDAGKNVWYYVLSTAAGKRIEGFPHTEEIDYCNPAVRPGPPGAARVVRLGEPFTLEEGGIVMVKDTGGYLALGKIGERVVDTKEFVVRPGDTISFGGGTVHLRAIGAIGNNTAAPGENAYFALEFVVDNVSVFAYSYGGAAGHMLKQGLYAYVLSAGRDDRGGLSAAIRLERRESGSGNVYTAYIIPPGNRTGDAYPAIYNVQVLAGQPQRIENAGYTLKVEGADAGRRQATVTLSEDTSKGIILGVAKCTRSPPRLILVNGGSADIAEAVASIYNNRMEKIGSIRVPKIKPITSGVADVEGGLVQGDMYLEYPGVPLIRFYC